MDSTLLFSRGYDAGNYAAAYVSQDFDSAYEAEDHEEKDLWPFRCGVILGFFASYEVHEIPYEHRHSYYAAVSSAADYE